MPSWPVAPRASRSGDRCPPAYCRLEIPTDIDGLRATDPALAARWREALRTVLPELVAAGRPVIDFDQSGAHVVAPERQDP